MSSVSLANAEKMAENIFYNEEENEYEKHNKTSRPLNSVHDFRTLEACIVGINVYVAHLSVSQAMASFGSLQSRLAVVPCCMFSICGNWPETTKVIFNYAVQYK